mmetsp:Transcript_10482/g.22759  ORF Transcript_10482/g.22759 Transcript_10482/m.22759 type:complete len:219 (+) Transcript_10482:41-697(+)
MRSTTVATVAAIVSQAGSVAGFSIAGSPVTKVQEAIVHATPSNVADRRSFFRTVTAGAFASALLGLQGPNAASAGSMPSVTVSEFQDIIRDSAKSISIVEFSGPRSETAVARLVDGTVFEITGLIDSPSDPRSPLKLAAICRASKIPTKFLNLELAVSSSGSKKKKSYANTRVQEAAAKERERKARMEADEQQRLAELYQMEEAEASKNAAAAASNGQ